MNRAKLESIQKMNALGKEGKPFIFLIDFEQEKPLVLKLEEETERIYWATPFARNFAEKPSSLPETWEISPLSYKDYKRGFDTIRHHIGYGDSFLVNYTCPTPVKTDLSLEALFAVSQAKYKVYLKDVFACFSPEIFVRINKGVISSFPMKGTIDASIPDAPKLLLNDPKEKAEHHTIVDLIRNDLSMVADQVGVRRFRYIDRIKTNRGELLQMSSEVSGILPGDFRGKLGSIVFQMLPAGSVSGAPKPKTLEVIHKAEGYTRGYYTGVFGYFDGENLDSCVLIRYIEKQGDKLVYKSGGGITYLSDCPTEYEEMIKKVYVPIA